MKKNYNYNDLVRFYNRGQKKLRSLLAQGKNLYKQDILKRRLARLFQLLSGMQTNLKYRTAAVALTSTLALFQPNAAQAQNSYPTLQISPFGLLNVGNNWSTTGSTDLDNDGDKDLMVGDKTGGFSYFRNVGTPTVPNFTTAVSNPFGLTAITSGAYSSVAFVDLDNDGDKDMISGDAYGDFYYYRNTGTATAPAFAAVAMNPFGLTTIATGYSAGSFADLDNDGDKDFMSGDKNGDFYYYLNTGTATSPAFAAPTTNPFGLAITGGKYSTTAFADMDADGDLDLLAGRNDGDFSYYVNNGTNVAPAFGSAVLNPFLLTGSTNGGSTPYFVDLDNDGDLDLFSGEAYGDIIYYQNNGPLGIKTNSVFTGLNIYPNPTSNDVTLHVQNSKDILSVEISNALGQVISSVNPELEISTITLPEAKGVYFLKITNLKNESTIHKIVKQ